MEESNNLTHIFYNAKLKSGETKQHHLVVDRDGTYILINCVDDKNNEMGFVSFSIAQCDYAWLYKIEVHEEYQNQKIGSALLDVMEYITLNLGFDSVEGTYNPSNSHAKKLYNSHNYFIPNQTHSWDFYDPHWRMYKRLRENSQQIRATAKANVENIEVLDALINDIQDPEQE